MSEIKINIDDNVPEPNNTLLALLRDGERPKPGEPGTLGDRLGAFVQAFLAHQTKVAGARRTPVKGVVTMKVEFVSGPDGSHSFSVTETEKRAKLPAGMSMVFTDEEGDLTSRPRTEEPITEYITKKTKEAANRPGSGV